MTPKRSSDDIGKRLAKYRKLAGLSAKQLSDRLNGEISRAVIANIESGRKSDLTVDQLIALAWALDIPPVALAIPTDDPYREVLVVGGDKPVTVLSHEAALVFGLSGSAAEILGRDGKSDLSGFEVARNEMNLSNDLAKLRYDAYWFAEWAKSQPDWVEPAKEAAQKLAEKQRHLLASRRTVAEQKPWMQSEPGSDGND